MLPHNQSACSMYRLLIFCTARLGVLCSPTIVQYTTMLVQHFNKLMHNHIVSVGFIFGKYHVSLSIKCYQN